MHLFKIQQKSIVNIYIANAILNKIRFVKIKWQTILNEGTIKIDKNVKFHYRVCFQGKGRVVIKSNVTFDYHLSGSNYNKIILQGRNFNSEIFIN